MDCAEAKLRIEPYVAGELPADEKEPLEAHLAGCAECRLDSELTRASRNPPTGNGAPAGELDPNAAPADFVESIQPKATDTPAPASAASKGESWTLEGIFGAGASGAAPGAAPGAEGAGAPGEPSSPGGIGPSEEAPPQAALDPRSVFEDDAPAASHETERDLPPPEVLRRPDPITRDEPPASDAPSWDFEPADVKGEAKPPEGSLFFAEEALSRNSGSAAKRKSAVSRLVFWSVGGFLGVGLLAASIWIAMTVQRPLPPSTPLPRPMKAGPGPGLSTPEAAVETGGTPSPEAGAPAAGAPAPVEAPTTVEAPPESPAVSPSPAAPPEQTAKTPPPAARSATPKATTASGSTPAPAKTAPQTSRTTAPPAPRTAAPQPGRIVSREPVDEEFDEPEFPQRPPAPTVARPRPTVTPTAPSPPASTAPAPPSATAQPPATEAPAAGPSGEAVQRPIDRLHLATLTAEQNADLAALRKLRDAWRGFVKTSIGPDRARAKRELADCLWAVQTLTAKASDQKEALAAYRDYVLNAPAGGADPRTVARMRQLEDAVAETR